jgi:hypothetical protein
LKGHWRTEGVLVFGGGIPRGELEGDGLLCTGRPPEEKVFLEKPRSV